MYHIEIEMRNSHIVQSINFIVREGWMCNYGT